MAFHSGQLVEAPEVARDKANPTLTPTRTLTLTLTPTPTPTLTRTPTLTLTLTLTRWVGRALLRGRPQGEEVAGLRLRDAPGLLQLHRQPRDFPPNAWRAAGPRPARAFPPRAPEPRARTRRRHTGECPDQALNPNPNPSPLPLTPNL